MDHNDFLKLLEVYTLEEILAQVDLTPEGALVILADEGYFNRWDDPRPL